MEGMGYKQFIKQIDNYNDYFDTVEKQIPQEKDEIDSIIMTRREIIRNRLRECKARRELEIA